MSRRNLGRAPSDVPIIHNEKETSHDWIRWFGQIAEHVFKVDKYQVAINPTSVSANTTSEQNFALSGVASNDMLIVEKPSHTAGLGIVGWRVSAKDQISITFMNCTGSPIDPPNEVYNILVMKV